MIFLEQRRRQRQARMYFQSSPWGTHDARIGRRWAQEDPESGARSCRQPVQGKQVIMNGAWRNILGGMHDHTVFLGRYRRR